MILTITCIITLLVAINFLLLVFSSNKTVKKQNKKPIILHPELSNSKHKLAATGS